MKTQNNRLVLAVSLLIAMIAITLIVNRWAGEEIKKIANDLPARTPAVAVTPAAPSPYDKKAVGHPVLIDPENDPLAPVVPKPRRQPRPSTSAEKPQRIYESPMNEVIIVQ
ncbi:MAG: hypothetical protein HZA28_08600 [Candidatus Omnitrophica bacterium]|nr:hypothetical protein [Candidatus Omnitrophota bacterium]